VSGQSEELTRPCCDTLPPQQEVNLSSQSAQLDAHSTPLKMTYWRAAGLTYLRFSRIAAIQLRKSLKPEQKVDPLRESSTIKVSFKATQVN